MSRVVSFDNRGRACAISMAGGGDTQSVVVWPNLCDANYACQATSGQSLILAPPADSPFVPLHQLDDAYFIVSWGLVRDSDWWVASAT